MSLSRNFIFKKSSIPYNSSRRKVITHLLSIPYAIQRNKRSFLFFHFQICDNINNYLWSHLFDQWKRAWKQFLWSALESSHPSVTVVAQVIHLLKSLHLTISLILMSIIEWTKEFIRPYLWHGTSWRWFDRIKSHIFNTIQVVVYNKRNEETLKSSIFEFLRFLCRHNDACCVTKTSMSCIAITLRAYWKVDCHPSQTLSVHVSWIAYIPTASLVP